MSSVSGDKLDELARSLRRSQELLEQVQSDIRVAERDGQDRVKTSPNDYMMTIHVTVRKTDDIYRTTVDHEQWFEAPDRNSAINQCLRNCLAEILAQLESQA